MAAGTMNSLLTRSCSMKSSTVRGSNSRATTPLAPERRLRSPQPEPPMCATGIATSEISSAVQCDQAMPSRSLTSVPMVRLRCVSIAPLGRPVVPEVYSCSTTSCGAGRCAGGVAGCASRQPV
ncbi:hypothetical protein D3C72_1854140 [compost metagenome]